MTSTTSTFSKTNKFDRTNWPSWQRLIHTAATTRSVRQLATSSSNTNKKGLREEKKKGIYYSMTRMSNENLTSSPGITSSYLYKVFY